MKKWSTKEQLTALLSALIRLPSVSGSEAEKELPFFVADQLSTLPYFEENPEHLQVHGTGDGRSFVTAWVRSKVNTSKTIILLSHFDVVEVDCYGEWADYAFDVEKLTALFYEHRDSLPEEVQQDLENGEWLFGRGVMDMKCGLALHMSLIERASCGEFEGNLLLLTVPDEEVNSVGMRAAIPVLLDLAREHKLEYELLINSEPMDIPRPGDPNYYLETGSIGKVLPAFFCYGQEAHAKEPFAGLNGNYMVAEVTCELELDVTFCERIDHTLLPPPTNLIQNDLSRDYSVTIPYRAVTMFNLFLVERSVDQVVEPLLGVAQRAAKNIERKFKEQAGAYRLTEQEQNVNVKVLKYEELYSYACQVHSKETVDQLIAHELTKGRDLDDRSASTVVVDALALLCKELAPMIVLFFAPPYYPSITSYHDSLIQELVDKLTVYTRESYGKTLLRHKYHSAMTDLSYVGSESLSFSNEALTVNMPVWEWKYTIPFKEMEDFSVPVLNLGPYGLDPHKWTERLNIDHAFGVLAPTLPLCLHYVFSRGKN